MERKLTFVIGCGILLFFASLCKTGQLFRFLRLETGDASDYTRFFEEFRIARNKTRLIVAWTTFFGTSVEEMGEWSMTYCPVKCVYSSNTALVSSADAVLFHSPNFIHFWFPHIRHSFQKYVFVIMEPPINSGFFLRAFPKNFFNWTMTYRSDSDIRAYYGQLIPNKKMNISRNYYSWDHVLNIVNMKTKMVVQFVSNCYTPSKRENYVEELSKSISVDIFGECTGIFCGTKEDCNSMLTEDYLFYLSFENSICRNYVTEKFWRLKLLIVPIVLRGSDYEEFAPKGSYIAADRFESPKQLAVYLNFLANNRTEYLKYFEWTKKYPYTAGQWQQEGFCTLCQALDNGSKEHKIYDNIEKWWTEEGDCHDNFAQNLLQKSH